MPQFGRQIKGRQASRRLYRSLLRSLSTLALLALIAVLIGACSGVNDSGSHPDFIETQAAGHPDSEGGHGGEGGDEGEASPEPGDEATPEPGGGEDLAAMGQELATANGCTGCHSLDGSAVVGPTWQGLYGHEVTLSDGSTVTADDAYIAESIRDPSAKIVEGFQDIMPKTFADWSDDQVNAIIAYIKTLE
jgi:cytochrome c1